LAQRRLRYFEKPLYGLIPVNIFGQGNNVLDMGHSRHPVSVEAIRNTLAWRHAIPGVAGHME
jgi:hypothetical protein